MIKKSWNKIKENHFLMMMLCCAIPISLIAGFIYLFKGNSDSLVWLIFILCPLMHIWMMKGHKHGKSHTDQKNDEEQRRKF